MENDRRQKPFLWQSVAYTIMAAEAYHRDQGIEFFGENVPSRCAKGLKYFTRFASIPVEDMGTDIRYLSKVSLAVSKNDVVVNSSLLLSMNYRCAYYLILLVIEIFYCSRIHWILLSN